MEPLKHECGVALVRLLKPLEYYQEKYGTWQYGLNKLYLMMEKEHNRGQEGAGIACVKMDVEPGNEYMFRERALGSNAITEVFDAVHAKYADLKPEQLNDAAYAYRELPFAVVLTKADKLGTNQQNHMQAEIRKQLGLPSDIPMLRTSAEKGDGIDELRRLIAKSCE